MEPFIEAIYRRSSVRTYLDRPIEAETKRIMLDLVRSNAAGPFGNAMRFEVLDFSRMEKQEIKASGTYGVIKGAQLFIVGATIPSDGAMEDTGYCLEKIILHLTNLGLGTCWMGGTFRRSSFARRIGASEAEIVPVISPVGHPKDKRAFLDRLMRFIAKSRKRKEWNELFFMGDFEKPLDTSDAREYAPSLECVRIAPSASNKQPWRIVKERDKNIYHFYLQRTVGYRYVIREFDLQRIDMGIAMCHFGLSALENGLNGQWEKQNPGFDVGFREYIVTWVGK